MAEFIKDQVLGLASMLGNEIGHEPVFRAESFASSSIAKPLSLAGKLNFDIMLK